jgi:hypothetical protein
MARCAASRWPETVSTAAPAIKTNADTCMAPRTALLERLSPNTAIPPSIAVTLAAVDAQAITGTASRS